MATSLSQKNISQKGYSSVAGHSLGTCKAPSSIPSIGREGGREVVGFSELN